MLSRSDPSELGQPVSMNQIRLEIARDRRKLSTEAAAAQPRYAREGDGCDRCCAPDAAGGGPVVGFAAGDVNLEAGVGDH